MRFHYLSPPDGLRRRKGKTESAPITATTDDPLHQVCSLYSTMCVCVMCSLIVGEVICYSVDSTVPS